jgi:hypothetical protein
VNTTATTATAYVSHPRLFPPATSSGSRSRLPGAVLIIAGRLSRRAQRPLHRRCRSLLCRLHCCLDATPLPSALNSIRFTHPLSFLAAPSGNGASCFSWLDSVLGDCVAHHDLHCAWQEAFVCDRYAFVSPHATPASAYGERPVAVLAITVINLGLSARVNYFQEFFCAYFARPADYRS